METDKIQKLRLEIEKLNIKLEIVQKRGNLETYNSLKKRIDKLYNQIRIERLANHN